MTPKTQASHILSLIQHLSNAVFNLRLFFPDHPSVETSINNTFHDIKTLTQRLPTLTFSNIDNTLVFNKVPFKHLHPSIPKFRSLLSARSLDHVAIIKGITKQEILQFLLSLASEKNGPVSDSAHLSLGTIGISNKNNLEPLTGVFNVTAADMNGVIDRVVHLDTSPKASTTSSLPSTSNTDNENNETNKGNKKTEELANLLSNIKTSNNAKTIDKLETALNLFIKGFTHSINPLSFLSSIKSFDEYTYVHLNNVFILTTAQAEFLGFQGKHLYDIGVAAILHDVGKLFIPDEIINKPGALDDEERTIMQSHSLQGSRYLLNVKGIPKIAAIAAMDHHIRYDGKGYPNIPGWCPNLVSQMISISDAFDAMRSKRPYQAPKPQAVIIDILEQESGTAFNPMLVKNFIRLLNQPAKQPKPTQ